MVEPMLIDLKALLVEREDCDAGTVQQMRNGLGPGRHPVPHPARRDRGHQEEARRRHRRRRQALAPQARHRLVLPRLHRPGRRAPQAGRRLAGQLLPRPRPGLAPASTTRPSRPSRRPRSPATPPARCSCSGPASTARRATWRRPAPSWPSSSDQASHNAEYHYPARQLLPGRGRTAQRPSTHLEKAVELDPGHTGALFQLAHANDLAGNDDEAIRYYERCLKHPPVHVGTLKNLGVLYEDHEKYDKAVECYRRVLAADPTDEQARLFYKDAQASLTMYYNPEEEHAISRFSQVLEIPVTDFELSVRSRNCLKKMNIRTLGDLTRVSEQQLLSSKNFGETSLSEIKEMLTTKGLRLGQSLEEGAQNDMRFRPQQPLSEQEQAVLNKPVSELNLSVRARKCMNRLGINTLGDLIQRTADELLESKNFGMTSLNEVREKLQAVWADAARRLTLARVTGARTRRDRARLALAIPLSRLSVSRVSVILFDVHPLRASAHRRRRPPRPAAHAARRRRDAGVHAGRHAGHRQGTDARAARRGRRADHPRQHLSPRAAARRRAHRRAGRPASLHGLGRPDPHRQRRLPGLQPRRRRARSTIAPPSSARTSTAPCWS